MHDFTELERAHTWLQGLRPLPPSVVSELRHRYEVGLTYHSNAIEGNTLTESETQMVIEKGITVAGKSLGEHLEVIGHKEALDFVIDLADGNETIAQRQILEIHSLVMKGQHGSDHGAYRNLDVKAAGTNFTYPSHLHLHELMQDFFRWLNSGVERHPVAQASEAHLRFVTIHPFRDGNGRVGRLLLNLLLLRAGYPIAILPVTARASYIEALESAQKGEGRDRLDHLVAAAVLSSLRDTLETAISSEEVRSVHQTELIEVEAWFRSRYQTEG